MSSEGQSLHSIIEKLFVGKPQSLTNGGRTWKTAIFKTPTTERILLSGENFEGDYQANRKYHGGPDKVVCAYCGVHYPAWRELYGETFADGAFGENVTLSRISEADICVGDRIRMGEAVVEVSQPRQPCANVSKRWAARELPYQMEETGRTGFYFRLISPGMVAAGDSLTLESRPYPEWTIARCNDIMYATTDDISGMTSLRAVQLLSAEWKRILGRQIAARTGTNPDSEPAA